MENGPLRQNVPELENRGLCVADEIEWVRVSTARPCPLCGGLDGCAVTADDRYARCRLVPSAHPVAGGGWLHAAPVLAG